MLATFRTYRSLSHLMALMIGIASILPFIQHACEMIGEGDAHHKKCCCVRSRQEPGHNHNESTAAPAHHGHQDYAGTHAQHAAHLSEAPVPCDHNSKNKTLDDDCCSWQALVFEGDAVRMVRSAKASLQFNTNIAALVPELVGVLDKSLLIRQHPPPNLPPSILSLPSRQVLFATFLI